LHESCCNISMVWTFSWAIWFSLRHEYLHILTDHLNKTHRNRDSHPSTFSFPVANVTNMIIKPAYEMKSRHHFATNS
jgi:hypothetical protein